MQQLLVYMYRGEISIAQVNNSYSIDQSINPLIHQSIDQLLGYVIHVFHGRL